MSERELLDALFAGTASLSDAVSRHMAAPFPLVGSGENIATVRAALHDSDAVMVIDDGKPVGVLTRADLLGLPGGGTPLASATGPRGYRSASPACVTDGSIDRSIRAASGGAS